MLLRELMNETGQEFKAQLYATDLDEDAIATARASVYPPNIAQDVDPERLRRYFIKEEGVIASRKLSARWCVRHSERHQGPTFHQA
jgi:chemotaxis methyl-accepting protein methylase